jgi:hypothetical protein
LVQIALISTKRFSGTNHVGFDTMDQLVMDGPKGEVTFEFFVGLPDFSQLASQPAGPH